MKKTNSPVGYASLSSSGAGGTFLADGLSEQRSLWRLCPLMALMFTSIARMLIDVRGLIFIPCQLTAYVKVIE